MYPTLLSPLDLGPVRLRNRVLMSGMTTGFGFHEGAPDADAIAYFRARSEGTAAVVVGFGARTPPRRSPRSPPPSARAAPSPACSSATAGGRRRPR